MAEKRFAGEHRSVFLNNIVEEIKALLELGVDVSRVWAECEKLLGDGPWDLDKLAKMRVPSRIYNRLQEVLKECAGHVHWLKHAAQQAYRKDMAWGGSEGLKRLAANFVLAWITYVIVGMSLANDGTATYNLNKLWEILYADRRRTIIRMMYIPGPHGEMLTAEDETRSVLDRVGHVLLSIATMWKHKRRGVKILSCNVRPQTRLDMEAPGTKCHVLDNVFYIADERYGRVIHLEHSRLAKGMYLGADESRDEPFDGGRAAILMERDYETRCTRTGKHFPILEAGQVYRHEKPLEEAIFEITHELNRSVMANILLAPLTMLLWLTRTILTWILVGKPNIIRFMYKNRIKDELAMKEAQRQREIAEAYAREQERSLRKMINAPNDVLLQSVRVAIERPDDPMAFKATSLPMGVMFIDMVDFTRWSENIPATPKVDFICAFHKLCQAICFAHGALIYKGGGDGGMAVFTCGYEGDVRDMGTRELVKSALDAAKDIMDHARNKLRIPGTGLPVNLRIGINAGTAEMAVMADRLDVIGNVVNYASRAEGACDTDEIVLTTEAVTELSTPEEQAIAGQLNATASMTDVEIRLAASMMFVGNGVRRVKQSSVETWALVEAGNARTTQLLATREQRAVVPETTTGLAGLEEIGLTDLSMPAGAESGIRLRVVRDTDPDPPNLVVTDIRERDLGQPTTKKPATPQPEAPTGTDDKKT